MRKELGQGKYTREYIDETGYKQVWTYDADDSPRMVEMFYPKGWFQDEIDEVENDKLPKTKRKYLNPINGKLVAYTRAKELGII